MAGEHNPAETATIESQTEHEEGAKCPELFELDDNQFVELKKRVEKWNGLVRVFIHPGGNFGDPERQKIKQIFLDVIDRPVEDAPPVIVFEEQPFFDPLSRGLPMTMESDKNLPYFVETINKAPFPVDEEYPEMVDQSHKQNDIAVPGTPTFERERDYLVKVMSKIATYFMGLGVKKILIGGNNLVHSEKNDRFEQCVGNLLEALRTYGFEVDVSEATAPLSGKDFRAIEAKRRKN